MYKKTLSATIKSERAYPSAGSLSSLELYPGGGAWMGSAWHIVAFPVTLPWREEFWTPPLYFPDLKVGVIPGWPEQLPYQGMPLPSEAEVHPPGVEHYKPGDLTPVAAFADYHRTQEEAGDNLLQAIPLWGGSRGPGPAITPTQCLVPGLATGKNAGRPGSQTPPGGPGARLAAGYSQAGTLGRSGVLWTRLRGRRNGGPRAGQTALPPVAPGDGPRDAGPVGPPAPGPAPPGPCSSP